MTPSTIRTDKSSFLRRSVFALALGAILATGLLVGGPARSVSAFGGKGGSATNTVTGGSGGIGGSATNNGIGNATGGSANGGGASGNATGGNGGDSVSFCPTFPFC